MLSLIKYYSCFVLLFLPSLAYGNYGVEPSRIEGSMPAGKTYENVYVITNPQSHAISVELEWRDYTINPLAKDWLVLSQTKVTVEAQSSVRVPITITIPENAAGEYTARVIFTQIPDKSDQVKFAIRYNNPIYIKIKGTEHYNFEVKNIQINNQKRFRVILATLNTGNVHIRPSGMAVITNTTNPDESFELTINQSQRPIIPNEQFSYTAVLDKNLVLPDGRYKIKFSLTAGEGDIIKTWSQEMVVDISGETVSSIDNAEQMQRADND